MARARMKKVPKGGLAGLVGALVGKNLEKPKGLRLGNWERVPLNEAQQKYAALDALASLLLAEKLHEMEDLAEKADKPAMRTEVEAIEQSALTPQKRRRSLRLSCGNENNVASSMPEVRPRTKAHLQKPMQQSKHEKYIHHYRQRETLDGIASHFGLKRGTVQAYLVEAIERGLPYHFDLLGVPPGALAIVRSVADGLPGALDDALLPPGTIKTIKESIDSGRENDGGGMDYGDIRLCVEHLRRKRMLEKSVA